jgi:hypothetical protein
MARPSKYKWETGDVVGLYQVIKPLPSEPNVKNLVIYAECLLCHEKVKRFSNRMDSKHRGCTAPAKVDKSAETGVPLVAPLPHTRSDGKPVETNEHGFVVPSEDASPEETILAGITDLPSEVQQALNFDVDKQALEMIKLAERLDTASNFVFMTTLKRYLALVHVARSLEKKLSATGELTVIGSTGSHVANPLITQYKTVSNEANSTAKILTNILAKLSASEAEDDPLLKALQGGS